MTTDLRTLIAEAVRRIEAQKVECPGCTGCKGSAGICSLTPPAFDICHGTKIILNPTYAPLLSVLVYNPTGEPGMAILRDVSGWPQGALCGAIGAALDPILVAVCQSSTFALWRTVSENVSCYDDEAALRALLASLPEVKADV